MWKNESRDPERIASTLAIIRLVWRENPDLRLGQLLLNACRDNLYNIEEDELEARLLEFYFGTCGCGYLTECMVHCNHEKGLCPGNPYKPS